MPLVFSEVDDCTWSRDTIAKHIARKVYVPGKTMSQVFAEVEVKKEGGKIIAEIPGVLRCRVTITPRWQEAHQPLSHSLTGCRYVYECELLPGSGTTVIISGPVKEI